MNQAESHLAKLRSDLEESRCLAAMRLGGLTGATVRARSGVVRLVYPDGSELVVVTDTTAVCANGPLAPRVNKDAWEVATIVVAVMFIFAGIAVLCSLSGGF